jgi:hypothetical protein
MKINEDVLIPAREVTGMYMKCLAGLVGASSMNIKYQSTSNLYPALMPFCKRDEIKVLAVTMPRYMCRTNLNSIDCMVRRQIILDYCGNK